MELFGMLSTASLLSKQLALLAAPAQPAADDSRPLRMPVEQSLAKEFSMLRVWDVLARKDVGTLLQLDAAAASPAGAVGSHPGMGGTSSCAPIPGASNSDPAKLTVTLDIGMGRKAARLASSSGPSDPPAPTVVLKIHYSGKRMLRLVSITLRPPPQAAATSTAAGGSQPSVLPASEEHVHGQWLTINSLIDSAALPAYPGPVLDEAGNPPEDGVYAYSSILSFPAPWLQHVDWPGKEEGGKLCMPQASLLSSNSPGGARIGQKRSRTDDSGRPSGLGGDSLRGWTALLVYREEELIPSV